MADRPNYAEAERIANVFAMPRGLGGIVLTVRTLNIISSILEIFTNNTSLNR